MADDQRDRIARAAMKVPLPRPDPRRQIVPLPQPAATLEELVGNRELDYLLRGGRQRNRIDFTPTTFADEAAREGLYGKTLRGISSRVDPERFEQAWQSWAPSQNVEVRPEPTPDERLGIVKDMMGRLLTARGDPKPDAPGWDWYQP
jgi:hypothetical protein